MSILILIRHGQSIWNLQNRFTGGVDVPLTRKGIKQAKKSGKELKKLGISIDHVYSSKLSRSVETARFIISNLESLNKNKKITQVFALNERDYGDLSGKYKDELVKTYGEKKVLEWRRSFRIKPPGGENLEDVLKRVKPFLNKKIIPLLKKGKNVLCVAHGNALRAFRIATGEYTEKNIFDIHIPPCVPVIYEYKNNGKKNILSVKDSKTNITSKFTYQIEELGLKPSIIHRNLSSKALIKMAVTRNEGVLTKTGALSVTTGQYTGRSPEDRFIVDDKLTHKTVDWGKINKPFPADKFNQILNKMKTYEKSKEFFVFDGWAGADDGTRLPVRMITDHAWQSLFVKTMFIEPTSEELEYHEPKFTVFNINDFEARPELDGTRTSTFILLNFTKKLAIIGGTRYGGENKKTIFGVLNFILPGKDIMPMHCSANLGLNGDTALFFGLSGTGKTTLSADPKRMLIGDDEHGWSDDGIFNFEGGCYAKTINLSKKAEPQIWNAIRDGAVLENVVLNPKTMNPDYDDDSLTENTRVVYPLDYIPGAVIPSVAGHPKSIIFLTADAFGVLPPISKLTTDGAMYHFMSGYTSKLAGTERGIIEPQPTFSHCFGSVFMPRPAEVYAKMLGERIVKHNTNVYLVNTGWSGGPYGVGKRFKIEYTRKMITAVLNQSLEKVNYERNKVFNLDVPKTCPGVPSKVLDPKKTWKNKKAYDKAAKSLAKMFVDNFKKFKKVSPNIKKAGPKG